LTKPRAFLNLVVQHDSWRAPLKPLFEYFAASRSELAKVSWPTRRQTVRLTILVVIFSIVFAILLGSLDLGFGALVQKIIVKG